MEWSDWNVSLEPEERTQVRDDVLRTLSPGWVHEQYLAPSTELSARLSSFFAP